MNNTVYKRKFFYKNKLLFWITIISTFISVCLSVGGAYLLQLILDVANEKSIQELTDVIIISGIFLISLFIMQMILRKTRTEFVEKAIIQFKEYAFQKISEKRISSFANKNTSSYISIFTNDIKTIEVNYLYGTFEIISMIISFLGALILMLWYNVGLTLIAIALCIVPILLSTIFGKQVIQLEKNISDANENFVSIVSDLFSGFAVIKSFKAEEQAVNLFKNKNNEVESLKCNRKKTELTISIISSVTTFVLQIGIFIIGSFWTIKGSITIGVVIAFVQLMNNIIEPIQQLPTLVSNRKAANALIEKITFYTQNCDDYNNEKMEYIDSIGEGIVCNELSFAYNQEESENNNILSNINLEFKAGKKYAIVGESGSGKSTLLNILLGGYDNYTGSIKIAERELRNIDKESLYKVFSIVQQNVFIFNNSIINNITMFKDFEAKKVEEALIRAGLSKLILEKGYEYNCGERGCNLSGGEKQRISIARCLLTDASVILMDEATSALDISTASTILNDLLKIEQLTAIIITHNLDEQILRKFDEIIVIRNGEVKEKGTFDDLIQNKKLFYSMVNLDEI
ncbi:MAG: ABC transporter ATP-binding protein [Clostridium sp.]|uniref:ABC transporter ATP-binding protein n=1 Tax=Clostridium sp. TaxID=1506 RepID=UPI002A90D7AB|nr:ABC transporter ATP-binding protein [Clostridium sp.]MDY6229095.1 ABC transporter ATP-binding protein [Clostridium sp.]